MAQGLPILVVEDDANLREAVCDTLELAGQSVLSAGGGEEALAVLKANAVALVVSDVRMMPMDGITLLKEIRGRYPHLPVVLMTAFAEVDRAVEAMRSGACDFLLKPFEPKALLEHVTRYRLPDVLDDDGVIAEDPASRSLFALATRVAQTDTTVLLTGESGVGKEVVARYIHNHSARRAGLSWPSIARRFQTVCWKRRCSATRRARSPVPSRRRPASLSKRRTVPCCWMK